MINFTNLNKILSNAGRKYPNLLIFENTFDNGVPSVSIRFSYKKTRDIHLIDLIDSLLYSEKELWNTKVYLHDPKIQLSRITKNVLIFKCSCEDLTNIMSDIEKCDFNFNIMRKWQKRLIHENSTEYPIGVHNISCSVGEISFTLTNVDVSAVTFKDVLDYYKPVNIIDYIKTLYSGGARVYMDALDSSGNIVASDRFETGDLNNDETLKNDIYVEKIKNIGNIANVVETAYKSISIIIRHN